MKNIKIMHFTKLLCDIVLGYTAAKISTAVENVVV
jgi:hypothetical protein